MQQYWREPLMWTAPEMNKRYPPLKIIQYESEDLQVHFTYGKNKGVFSTKDYEIGQLVYTFEPYYIEEPTRTSIQVEDKHFEDDTGMYLSCIVSDERGIHLFAIDIIKKKDEITFDYNTTEDKITHPFKCNCHGKLIKGKTL